MRLNYAHNGLSFSFTTECLAEVEQSTNQISFLSFFLFFFEKLNKLLSPSYLFLLQLDNKIQYYWQNVIGGYLAMERRHLRNKLQLLRLRSSAKCKKNLSALGNSSLRCHNHRQKVLQKDWRNQNKTKQKTTPQNKQTNKQANKHIYQRGWLSPLPRVLL